MKTIITICLAVMLWFAALQPASAQTAVYRIDTKPGAQPYHTLGIILEGGWELWSFGYNDRKTADLEVGKFYPVGKWSLGNYFAYWPESNKSFLLPMAIYNDTIGGAKLSLNLGTYLPLNGGPHLTISNESSAVWSDKYGYGIGVTANYLAFEDSPAWTRMGPTLRFPLGKMKGKITYQPWFIQGRGDAMLRFELGFQL